MYFMFVNLYCQDGSPGLLWPHEAYAIEAYHCDEASIAAPLNILAWLTR